MRRRVISITFALYADQILKIKRLASDLKFGNDDFIGINRSEFLRDFLDYSEQQGYLKTFFDQKNKTMQKKNNPDEIELISATGEAE